MVIEAIAKSDPGLVREVNEDSVAVLEDHGLVILADGMGGYNAGEVASQLVVEHITTTLISSFLGDHGSGEGALMESAVVAANGAILDAVEHTPEYKGMATTVVIGLFTSDQVHYAHVGDSRIYRFRDGKLEQLTRDHSMIEALIDEGMFDSIAEAEEAGVKKNVLVRGVGIASEVQVDIGQAQSSPGDLFLFCSDGLSNMVTDEEMQTILSHNNKALSSAAEKLLASALKYGGLDNISLALVRPGNGN
jgi:protein phosphatase